MKRVAFRKATSWGLAGPWRLFLALACVPCAGPSLAAADCQRWGGVSFFAEATAADVERCLNAGADANAREDGGGRTALNFALWFKEDSDPAVVKALVDAGADVNARGAGGWAPLHMAALKDDPAAVRVLVDADADVNARTEMGSTPLHVAMRGEDPDPATIRALVDAGANPGARDGDGNLPIDLVAGQAPRLRATKVYWLLNDARFE